MSTTPARADTWARLWRGRARVAEAMVLLTGAGVAQKLVPMQRWSRVIGKHAEVPSSWTPGPAQKLPVRSADIDEDRVRRAIRRGAQRLPWTPSCLAEALAAQLMLRQLGRAGVVVIGLRASDAGSEWEAHAWLLGERGALTGGPAAEGFTATTVFEVPGALRATDVDLAPSAAEKALPPRR